MSFCDIGGVERIQAVVAAALIVRGSRSFRVLCAQLTIACYAQSTQLTGVPTRLLRLPEMDSGTLMKLPLR